MSNQTVHQGTYLAALNFLQRDLNSLLTGKGHRKYSTKNPKEAGEILKFPGDNPFLPQEKGSLSNRISIEPKTISPTISRLFQSIASAFDPVRSHIIGFWIHGSLSTQDYTPFSDVDGLLIFRDNVLEKEEQYRDLKVAVKKSLVKILEFDPWQHHGIFIAPESLLASWPSSFLPAAALQFAEPLVCPDRPLILMEYHSVEENKEMFGSLCDKLISPSIPKNLYEAKLLLSETMLLPAMYCQALGYPMYKRDAFPLVEKQFLDVWNPIREATQMRRAWKKPFRPLWSTILQKIHPWKASRIYRQFEITLPKPHHYPNWKTFVMDIRVLASSMKKKILG